jgi:hypothetical protein
MENDKSENPVFVQARSYGYDNELSTIMSNTPALFAGLAVKRFNKENSAIAKCGNLVSIVAGVVCASAGISIAFKMLNGIKNGIEPDTDIKEISYQNMINSNQHSKLL